MINISSNFNEVSLEFNKFGKGVEKATISALNKTAAQGKVFASREVKKEYNIKSSYAKRSITVGKAFGKKMVASIKAKGKKLSLGQFAGTKQKARGVEIHVRRGHKKLLRGAFVAIVKNNHKGVWYRKGKKRFPIVERYTLSIADMFRARKVMVDLSKFISNKLPEVFKERLNYYSK